MLPISPLVRPLPSSASTSPALPGLPAPPAPAVLIADVDERVVHVEGEAFANHGLRTADWVGRPLSELMPPEALPVLVPRYRAALGGIPQSFEYWSQDATRAYRVHVVPVRDCQGTISSVVAVMQDTTEHLLLSAELTRSEARLHEAERMVGVGSWELALATREITFSPGMARLLGLAAGERLDLAGHRERVHPDDRALLAAAGERCRTTGSASCEYRLALSDGTRRIISLRAELVCDERGAEHLRGAALDVTERKQRELQLEHHVGDAIWLSRIRAALDEQRLLLYTQPIVDLTTGAIVQHELLLRMRAEDGSIISPGEFLPVAERYGLISEIDRWVIREAVRIAAAGTPTEFNLSARSVGDPLIIHELATAIAETVADPSLLVVEVTETALLGRIGVGREFAERVRALGCRLALDDFGTGFSSLSYLKHLPADYLKIDIDFVRELTSSDTDVRVVRGIVGLAREFNQVTIAEGVEDEATLLALKELGVDQAQGHLFARPAPRAEALDSEPCRQMPPPGATGGVNRAALVGRAFDAFAARDVPAMLRHCRPDIVLRSLATSQLANRSEPYRGHDGVRAYLQDVANVWDDLTFTPMEVRETQESVIGFGQTEGRRGADVIINSVLWIVRVQEGQIASIEVFQAATSAVADHAAAPVPAPSARPSAQRASR